jgi:hypothetical protein
VPWLLGVRRICPNEAEGLVGVDPPNPDCCHGSKQGDPAGLRFPRHSAVPANTQRRTASTPHRAPGHDPNDTAGRGLGTGV